MTTVAVLAVVVDIGAEVEAVVVEVTVVEATVAEAEVIEAVAAIAVVDMEAVTAGVPAVAVDDGIKKRLADKGWQ
jgi:hypothetical protein